jgi:Flp pilus assembly protein TadD
MRSADQPKDARMLRRSAALGAMCFALAGCSTLGESFKTLKDKVTGEPTAASNPEPKTGTAATVAARPASAPLAAPTPPPAAAPVVVAKPEPAPEKIDVEPPVSTAAQRAFDDAKRALRAGRQADAERAFKALTVSNPELGGPHANLGLIYRQAGRSAESVAEFEKAVLASPRQAIFHNQLGIAYRLNGQFTKARTAYEKAIDLDADYAAPHLNLGILHDLYLWDGKRALELYDRYLALSPGGDTTVVKWVADLKNRKPQHAMLTRKEKE